jgi:hypothetical protein
MCEEQSKCAGPSNYEVTYGAKTKGNTKGKNNNSGIGKNIQ